MKKVVSVILFSVIAMLAFHANAEKVILKSGKVLEGKIIEQTDAGITLDVDGMEIPIPAEKIKEIRKDNETGKPPIMPEFVLQNGHWDKVNDIDFSPDGEILASGSDDCTVNLWSVDTGELLRSLEGHYNEVNSVDFSPDGKTLASGSNDTTVKLWSVDTGELLRSLEGHSDIVSSVVFSPDGKTIASGSEDNTVKLWAAETGELLHSLEGHLGRVTSVVFSPDGKTIASGSWDNTVKLWSVDKGAMLHSLEGHLGTVTSVVFSPDGKIIASGGGFSDGTVKLWYADTGELLHSLEGHPEWCSITSVVFSPDGKTIASGSEDNTVKLWSVDTGELLHSLEGHSYIVSSVVFSPDGKTIASGSWDNTVKLWSVDTGVMLYSLEGHFELPVDSVSSVVFSPDGETIASGSVNGTVKLWSVDAGELLHSLEGHSDVIRSIVFSPDGKTIASGGSMDGTVKLWSVDTGELLHSLEGYSLWVESVVFSPDGKTIAAGSLNATVELWSVDTGKLLHSLEGHPVGIISVAFSPDGKTIASGGSMDGTVKLWSVNTGKLLHSLEGHGLGRISVAFSPDGKTVTAGSWDHTIMLWSVDTGVLLYSTDGPSAINSVVFNPDGKTIASGSRDGTVKLWFADTGELLRSLEGHSDSVISVVFSPDGKTIASGSSDGTVKLWSVVTGELQHSLEGHSNSVISVAFSPDGRFLASGSSDTTIKLWNPETGQLLATLTSFDDDNWFVRDSAGRFDCSGCASISTDNRMKYIRWRYDNSLYMPDQFFDLLFKPGLLADVVRKGEVESVGNMGELLLKQPPLVEITFPLMHQYTFENETKIRVSVRDVGGGAKNVRLYHEGRPVNAPFEDVTPADAPAGTKEYLFTVPLIYGSNRFIVVAMSDTGIESRPAEVIVNSKSETITPPKLYLLTVGINEYDYSKKNLRYAVPDADAFANTVVLGGKDIFLSGIEDIRLRDAQATRANINREIMRIYQNAAPGDMVVVYFSGHGTTVAGKWYFLTHELADFEDETIERNAFSERELRDFLSRLSALKVALVLDACQSGQMVYAMNTRGTTDDERLRAISRSTGTFILASAMDAQSALEDYNLGHGVFTYFLLKGLAGEADPQGDSIEVRELINYTDKMVPEYTENNTRMRQEPLTYNVSRGGVGGMGPTLVLTGVGE